MNKEFLKQLKNSLKDIMKENNFKINGQSYVRIINKQIIQNINFQGFSGGDSFTINMGITPICSYELPCLPNPLIRIGNLFCGGDKGWNYSENSLDEVIDIIKSKVLPLLNKLSDYDKIYEELKTEIDEIPRENKSWSNKKTILYYSIGENSMFWLCIRNNDYDKCRILLKNQKKVNENWLNSCLESSERDIKNTQSKKKKKIFEDYKKNYIEIAKKESIRIENLEELLNNKEFEKLISITKEFEEKNLNTLKKYVI